MNTRARIAKNQLSQSVHVTTTDKQQSKKSLLDRDVLDIINQHKRAGVPFITRSHWLSSDLATKVSYMLNSIMGGIVGRKVQTNTIFYNSDIEALSGAIRLSRLNGYNEKYTKDILIYDGDGYYKSFYNPTNTECKNALCPNIKTTLSREILFEMVENDTFCAAILILDEYTNNEAFINEFISLCKRYKITSVIFSQKFDIENIKFKSDITDVTIIGDILTSGTVPCAVSIIKNEAYQAWNNSVGSAVFMSTWAGNTLAMGSILRQMKNKGLINSNDKSKLDWIEKNYENRVEAFKEYSHPPLYDQIDLCGFSSEIIESNGLELSLEDGRKIIDVGGSLGCSLGGDTSTIYYNKLIEEYSEVMDYNTILENLLTSITSFEKVIPAVSGATAVEIGISMAMMANPKKSKIVTFRGNYSGKSLIAVNASKTSHIIVEPFPEALGPYYYDMVYIDPFSPDAPLEVEKVLSDDEVALVWFEITQGYMCEPIPKTVLKVIEDNKKEQGYFVGVDEVLTGMYRNGSSILSHNNSQLECVDVVSMSKASSDLTYPIAWTLVKNDLYNKAKSHNLLHVEKLSGHYQYKMGSYIGLSSIRKLISAIGSHDFIKYQEEVLEGLQEIVRTSPVLGGVKSDGSLYRFTTNFEWFPFSPKSHEMTIIETVLTKLIIDRCNVMLNNLRIFPPIIPDNRVVGTMLKRLSSGLKNLTPLDVYKTIYKLMGSKIEESGIPEFINKTSLKDELYN